MIRLSVKQSGHTFEDIETQLDDLTNITYEVGSQVVEDAWPEMLTTLSKEPQSPQRSIEWTSKRQRQAYFASNGFGGGIPYRRRQQVSGKWQLRQNQTPDGLVSYVENTSPSAKFLYGTLTQKIAQAKKPQQRFHSITGWILASPVLRKWFQSLKPRIEDKIRNRVEDLDRVSQRFRSSSTPFRR
ncbi:MAG: hypothetical protein HC888_05890 [Candidatus Competibacteraceae bacterium]|nr:hypothetical protein [Candidatus Competibacteraceae bacterium]